MSLIKKEISDFTVQCYQNHDFRTVSKADVMGKWSVFFFYPADFTFVCPTELEDLADKYEDFQKIGCEIYSVSCDSTLSIRLGTMPPSVFKRFATRCWRTPRIACRKILRYTLRQTAWQSAAVSL